MRMLALTWTTHGQCKIFVMGYTKFTWRCVFSLDQNLKYSISGYIYNKLVVYLQSSKNNQVSDVIQ